jgi:hypothetical protein
MRAILMLSAYCLVLLIDGLSAQRQPPVYAGARVRVSAPGEGYRGLIGTVSGYDGETIGITPDNQHTSVWVPLTSVKRLQESRGQKGNTRKGAFIGLVVGGALCAAVGAATYQECVDEPGGRWDCFMVPQSTGEQAALGGLAGVIIGAGIGALIGASSKTDRWEEVPLDRLRVSFAPQRDGRFTLGFTFAF